MRNERPDTARRLALAWGTLTVAEAHGALREHGIDPDALETWSTATIRKAADILTRERERILAARAEAEETQG
jgi:hypothetical protein